MLKELLFECTVPTATHLLSSSHLPPLEDLTLILNDASPTGVIHSLETLGRLTSIKTLTRLWICTLKDVKLKNRDYGVIAQSLPNLTDLAIFPLTVSLADGEPTATLGVISLIAEHLPKLSKLAIRACVDVQTLVDTVDPKQLPHASFAGDVSFNFVLSHTMPDLPTARFLAHVCEHYFDSEVANVRHFNDLLPESVLRVLADEIVGEWGYVDYPRDALEMLNFHWEILINSWDFLMDEYGLGWREKGSQIEQDRMKANTVSNGGANLA